MFALRYYFFSLIKHARYQEVSSNFENLVTSPFTDLCNKVTTLAAEIHEIESHFEQYIEERSKPELAILNSTSQSIQNNIKDYIGAIGEEKVLGKLLELPDSYTIINDYQMTFQNAIYNKNTHKYIKSIQIDHVVIGPTGIYLIETKNWTEQTVNNEDIYSPIEQLTRSQYVTYLLLNPHNSKNRLRSFHTHWGTHKITPKSILLMTNFKPRAEFPYIKILSLFQLNSYILSGTDNLSSNQVRELVNFFNTNDSFAYNTY